MPLRRTRPLVVALVTALSLATTRAASGEPSAPTASPRTSFVLSVDSDAPTLSFDALAPRLRTELRAEIAREATAGPQGTIHVRYRDAEHALTVRVTQPDGRAIERTVRTTSDASQAGDAAILLTSNLAHDEARELIEALEARRKPPPEPSPEPTPAPSPQPTPTPSAPTTVESSDGHAFVNAGFLFPIAFNAKRPELATNLDVSILYGRVGTVRGLQLGLGAVRTTREVRGSQIAIGATFAEGEVRGAQIAVGANVANARVDGAQVGIVNVTPDLHGAQVGIVNVARKVRGAQVGIVNFAEDVDGAAIGLVSINRSSIHPTVWVGNLNHLNAGIAFESRSFYTVSAITLGSLETNLAAVGYTLGIGNRFELGRSFDAGAEATYSQVWPADGNANHSNRAVHGRGIVGFAFAPHLRVFAGFGGRFPALFEEGRGVVRPEGIVGVRF